MNGAIFQFASKHKNKFGGRVLEVGSRNVNGTIRDVLPITVGIDFIKGEGVDLVMNVTELLEKFGPDSFDCVVSCDALEHIEDWDAAWMNMWGVLKPGGVALFTMAGPWKGMHGYPHDYHRMPLEDFVRVFGENKVLDSFEGGPSLGAVAIKSTDLDMTIRPGKVGNPQERKAAKWRSLHTRN